MCHAATTHLNYCRTLFSLGSNNFKLQPNRHFAKRWNWVGILQLYYRYTIQQLFNSRSLRAGSQCRWLQQLCAICNSVPCLSPWHAHWRSFRPEWPWKTNSYHPMKRRIGEWIYHERLRSLISCPKIQLLFTVTNSTWPTACPATQTAKPGNSRSALYFRTYNLGLYAQHTVRRNRKAMSETFSFEVRICTMLKTHNPYVRPGIIADAGKSYTLLDLSDYTVESRAVLRIYPVTYLWWNEMSMFGALPQPFQVFCG